jgi:hypothetical protein
MSTRNTVAVVRIIQTLGYISTIAPAKKKHAVEFHTPIVILTLRSPHARLNSICRSVGTPKFDIN